MTDDKMAVILAVAAKLNAEQEAERLAALHTERLIAEQQQWQRANKDLSTQLTRLYIFVKDGGSFLVQHYAVTVDEKGIKCQRRVLNFNACDGSRPPMISVTVDGELPPRIVFYVHICLHTGVYEILDFVDLSVNQMRQLAGMIDKAITEAQATS